MKHLSKTDLAAIVTGAAAVDDATRSHLRECPECADRLAAEARVECMLIAHASSSGEGRDSRRRKIRRALMLAAAAGVVLVAGLTMHGFDPQSPRIPSDRASSAHPVLVPASTSIEPPPGAGVLSPSDFCRTVRVPEYRRAALDASALDTLRSEYGASSERAAESVGAAFVLR